MSHISQSVPEKVAPRELTTTGLRRLLSDVVDDAWLGHVTYLRRGSRTLAAVVPVAVARAYEDGVVGAEAARASAAAEVARFKSHVDALAAELLANVRRGAEPVDDEQTDADR